MMTFCRFLVYSLLCSIAFLLVNGSNVNIDALIASMSLEEKIGQMTQIDITVFMNYTTGEVNYNLMRAWMETYHVDLYIVYCMNFII